MDEVTDDIATYWREEKELAKAGKSGKVGAVHTSDLHIICPFCRGI